MGHQSENRMSSSDASPMSPEWDRLFEMVYLELRNLAHHRMLGERDDHTLQPTALVHETYLKLKRQKRFEWKDRTHFLCQASLAMRQVLVDFARKRGALKRRGERVDWTLSSLPQRSDISPEDYLAVHEALSRLADRQHNGFRQSLLVEYVWLGGMGFSEAAAALGISRRQAHRDWAYARVWLERELGDA